MNCQDLALWYLRLNGFLTVTNFVLHPPRRDSQLTEADIVAVRFPYRAELDDNSPIDDPEFTRVGDKPYFAIAEIARSECKLNQPWTKQSTVIQLLRNFGPLPLEEIQTVSTAWSQDGVHSSRTFHCSFLCFGTKRSHDLEERYPKVPQKTWIELIDFFDKRFSTYFFRKLDHDQWGLVGNALWNLWKTSRRERDAFAKAIREKFNLPT